LHHKIGTVLEATGDVAGATTAHRTGLTIAEDLARTDQANSGWQDDLWRSLMKVGDALAVQHDFAEALRIYLDALAIGERLAQIDPDNVLWRQHLPDSYESVGDVLAGQGDFAGAAESYRAYCVTAERFAREDRVYWQYRLSNAKTRLGKMMILLDDQMGALEVLRASHAIVEQLAQSHPAGRDQLQKDVIALRALLAKLGDEIAAARTRDHGL
jgi:tetratricopeptide (TPR) repeat protein